MAVTIDGTNGITNVNGSATTPAETGTDTDTGIYYGTNTVSLATGGTQRFTIDSSGNVGVGTSSPGAKLSVSGTSTWAHINGGNSNTAPIFASLNNETVSSATFGWLWYNNSTNGNLDLYRRNSSTTDTQVLTFTRDNGDVGIGGTPNNYSGQKCLTINNATGYVRMDFNIGGVKKSSIYGEGSSNMIFETAGSERMRIDSSGNVLVGTTSASNSGSGTRMQIAYDGGGTQYGLGFRPTTNTTVPIQFGNASGATVGTISQDASNVAYNTSSDYRLKENIVPMTGALAKVSALKPCTYNWKLDGSAGQGFIAHELAEVCPQAVTGKKDAVDENGKPVYQGVDTSFLVATLTAAIQELKAEFDAYKAAHP